MRADADKGSVLPVQPDPERLRALLAELDDAWSAAGLPIAHHTRPGLDPDEVRRQCHALDLEPPVELVTWFGWHDGTDVRHAVRRANHVGIDHLTLISLTEALEIVVAHWQPTDPTRPSWGLAWRDGWVPIAREGNGTVLVVDCRRPAHEPSPVRRFHPDDDAHADVVHHASIADLAADWAARLRAPAGTAPAVAAR